ncbi:hypothetical protein KPH14_008482 [Odynerus spinipes]|uniref:C2H2-type domain-containing protein n=1 Tax=Odynerus spinipes TaxID=1348599 RepID=A0AAD9RF64_9HYME|nr:hypothetical protein KPH14_008482 [Odynerus spinipes]
MHITKDNVGHTIVKSDTANEENTTIFKNNADNDLNIITFSKNSTSNASEVSLWTQKDLVHYSDNENKFPRENNESELILLKSDITIDDSVDNDNAIIKLDSSDESQSTIEILPASPDLSQIQIKKHNNLNNEGNELLYSEDAIPTQFELELEVTDSNIDSLDVPLLRHELNSENMNDNKHGTWQLDKKIQDFDNSENYSQDCIVSPMDNDQKILRYKVPVEDKISDEENILPSISTFTHDNLQTNSAMKTVTSHENLCCNDLLMKEVLAAKEMLKKCLSMSKSGTTMRSKSELEILVDKNQDSCFTSSNYTKSFLKNVTSRHTCETDNEYQERVANKLTQQKSVNKFNLGKSKRKDCNERVKTAIKFSKCAEKEDSECAVVNVQNNLISAQNSPIISLKTLKRFSQSVPNKNVSINIKHSKVSENRNENSLNQDDHIHHLENKVQDVEVDKDTYSKIIMISDNEDLQIQDNKTCNESRRKEDNMPILKPEISFNNDVSSDRDSSRSPPVITNQEVITTQHEVLKCMQAEGLISKDEKDDNKKHIEKEYDMTVTDIVTQLAYHKKSTITHKRYCTLCEKWFPTTSRHRRHLAGYQHRHLELAQRRTIHALFILFTGKPCSKLLQTTTMRDDCSIGELTPLQIAVQDLAKCMDGTEADPLIQKRC